jgi:hypothetical protein
LNSHSIAPLAVAAVAVVLGCFWFAGALLTRRRRTAFASTYASAGGIVYTVFQLGCAGALIVIGVAMLLLVMVSSR